ncbi:hypothetical protein GN277_29065 (plasmid) [Lachnospiraceae bacterium WCA-9-b2]|uniref:Uncharacterized protein n=1 Tax=Sporofaciens musculi TaxID=2681861 RepID=A0A7X3MMK6_9FIRM|nr:hypothetical protein [Sporofaciens musculi]MXP79208.1 hypothetical protein [Sporofaciens musculi]
MKKGWFMGYWRWAGLFMAWLLMAWIPLSPVHAADKARQEDVYDSLQESIEKNWTDGFEHLEATDEIEVKGPLMERILRSIANVFYRHLVGIKGWSLFIGVISLVVGVFIAVTAKLNKKLRRFAITFFVVTVPLLLIIFTFGITKLVSIFI